MTRRFDRILEGLAAVRTTREKKSRFRVWLRAAPWVKQEDVLHTDHAILPDTCIVICHVPGEAFAAHPALLAETSPHYCAV